MQYRQGDVFLVRVGEIPDGATKRGRARRLVLAEGEATGHHHVLERGTLYMTGEEVERRFVEIASETILTHQEHDTIAVAPGLYEVRRQREYEPKAAPRPVAD